MQILLPIYAISNIVDPSWGTRDQVPNIIFRSQFSRTTCFYTVDSGKFGTRLIRHPRKWHALTPMLNLMFYLAPRIIREKMTVF